ncbi:endonuclease NucS domain-containing protein [Desulfonatronum thioautotrophicum]|uniref:endonuclease NucS domain-containing protein n=1 Tax=Desulfonatronum thioautotrophicum TaxID=617001 RepID=UPI0005EAD752|nr:endonuclease NucS domain-containing protein [Desulfonatronum thioautotrophicum]
MTERDFENILERYPELIEPGLSLQGRQLPINGKFIDLLYMDRHGQKLIVELKIGAILRNHIGQLLDYEGEILAPDDPTVRVMIIGNRVPTNLRRSLEHHGFEWKELSISELYRFLIDQNDTDFLLYFADEEIQHTSCATQIKNEFKNIVKPTSTIMERVLTVMSTRSFGETFSRKQIIDMVQGAYPEINRTSVIPSDYCYNIINKGIKFQFHIFEYIDKNKYKFLGADFDYDGPIYWKGKKVGEWREGENKPRLSEIFNI